MKKEEIKSNSAKTKFKITIDKVKYIYKKRQKIKPSMYIHCEKLEDLYMISEFEQMVKNQREKITKQEKTH